MRRCFQTADANGFFSQRIGAELREVREAAGLTQCELAMRLGVSQAALSRLESQADMLISTIRDYLMALGASWEFTASFSKRLWTLSSFPGMEEESASGGPAASERVGGRDVVFSIKPKYADQILSGAKTVELRRRFPTNVPSGSNALIYATSPTRAMTGVASIQEVIRDCPKRIWRRFSTRAGINRTEYDRYFAGSEFACAIVLEDARPLNRSMRLDELRERFEFEPPQSFLYAKPELRKALMNELTSLSN